MPFVYSDMTCTGGVRQSITFRDATQASSSTSRSLPPCCCRPSCTCSRATASKQVPCLALSGHRAKLRHIYTMVRRCTNMCIECCGVEATSDLHREVSPIKAFAPCAGGTGAPSQCWHARRLPTTRASERGLLLPVRLTPAASRLAVSCNALPAFSV